MCASEFEGSAFGLLEQLYKTDPDKSKKLVVRPLKTWNGTNIYQLAVDADLTDFKTHDTSQAYLDQMWRGHIPARLKLWQVGLYVFNALRGMQTRSNYENSVCLSV